MTKKKAFFPLFPLFWLGTIWQIDCILSWTISIFFIAKNIKWFMVACFYQFAAILPVKHCYFVVKQIRPALNFQARP
ncbi:hypothetical protein CW304_13405 [Bacillus sp. UFRGS-B20]|nr:hypothetical protein CW304_13405 [Bacillus sp. UFRGS-B20]